MAEIQALKNKLENTQEDILSKNSTLTVQDLKRLLFRCAATLISLEKVCDITPLLRDSLMRAIHSVTTTSSIILSLYLLASSPRPH